jgi:hypothetical protein
MLSKFNVLNVHQPGDACRDSGILPGTPDPAEAGTPDQCCPNLMFSTFISRLDACRDSGTLPGTPDPAEAGTPDQR